MWKLKTVLPLIGLLLFTASHCQCRELNLTLDYKTAEQLAALPLECYNKEFPYKSSIVMNGTQDVQVFEQFLDLGSLKLNNNFENTHLFTRVVLNGK